MILANHFQLYGLWYTILCNAATDDEANDYMRAHEDAGLLAITPDGRRIVAAKSDKGRAVPDTPDRKTILAMLHAWVAQRPGLDENNYGDTADYRSDLRSIARDCTQAHRLLRFVELHHSIDAARLMKATRDAFGGRLTIEPNPKKPGEWHIDYCTGQYWPTEYRSAVCAVLASAIWSWYRDECVPDDVENKGEAIRKWAYREFGRGIGARWFK